MNIQVLLVANPHLGHFLSFPWRVPQQQQGWFAWLGLPTHLLTGLPIHRFKVSSCIMGNQSESTPVLKASSKTYLVHETHSGDWYLPWNSPFSELLGSPSSPTEQWIFVSSSSRGHIVFVKTQVESPFWGSRAPCTALSFWSPLPTCLTAAEAISTQGRLSLSHSQSLQSVPPLPHGLKSEFALTLL